MSIPALGIDIAKETFDAVLLVSGKTCHKSFANTPSGFTHLTAWLHKHHVRQVHACMEATGIYYEALALYLHDQLHPVSVINPACIRAYAQSTLTRTKTDKTDAGVQARYCHTQHPAVWIPPTPEVRELQALSRRLETLQSLRQQEANRLGNSLASAPVQASLEASLAFFDEQIARLSQQITAHLAQHPRLQAQHDLLISIPGIGSKTAVKLLAECGDLTRFRTARELAAYAGLTPKERASGTSVHGRPRLSKTGSSPLRKALYFPAIVAQRYNPIVQGFCERLRQRGKHPMAIIGAAMRKLLHLAYGVLKSGKPFDPLYRSPAIPTA